MFISTNKVTALINMEPQVALNFVMRALIPNSEPENVVQNRTVMLTPGCCRA